MAQTDARQLHRSNARLTQVIASMSGGVLVEDEHRCIAFVNQAFCDMFGINEAPDALIGTDCTGNPEASKGLFLDPDGFVRGIHSTLEVRQPVTGETLHLTDGRVFARDYVPFFQDDEHIGHVWHYHDVTGDFATRRRWERLLQFEGINREINQLFLQHGTVDVALDQALAMSGQLMDTSRAYVFRFRENERIMDNTHEWCAPGVTAEIDALKGMRFDDLMPSFFPLIAENDLIAPRHIHDLPEDLHEILEQQDIKSALWIPLYLNNRIEGFVGYDENRQARDWLPEEITLARILTESYARALEREQAALMLVQARDEAVRTAQLRAQFVANMSHELRTPMTGVLGMLELLLETELDDLQQEFAAEAFNSSSRLLEIINDILDFSRLEAGQVVLGAEPLDLRAIATEVKMTLAPQLKGKPVEIRLAIADDVPNRVHGDATRIRQVLMNLAGNAVKFTHEGRVIIGIDALRRVDAVCYLRFRVEDTGIGIPRSKVRQIFESFVQADGGTTRKYGGSGLGLSISRQLVGLMGGEIVVDSVPDAGSTFSFVLAMPVKRGDDSRSADALDDRDVEPPPTRLSDLRGRLLIADDYSLNIDLVKRALIDTQIEIDSAENGQEVLNLLARKPFDLVLMDMQMPVLDGLEATRRIRESDTRYKDIPILALTASVMRAERERYKAVGVDAIISKPFSVRDLRETIREWLEETPVG